MEVKAVSKYVRMSPDKARDLARRLKGLPVAEALKTVEFSRRKAGVQIAKTLKSAIANAQNNAKLSPETLRVKEAIIDAGPTALRYWPRARGMVSPVLRKTCHVKVVLTDGQ
jgi:large subunit ribosomal protein L22